MQVCTRICIVTCIPIARQRVGKHIPVEANARNNRLSIPMQRRCKHASLILQMVISVGSVPRSSKRAQLEEGTEYRTVVESSRFESSESAAAE
jgi:hypothetical protein